MKYHSQLMFSLHKGLMTQLNSEKIISIAFKKTTCIHSKPLPLT